MLSQPFFWKALLSSILIGIIGAIIGVFIILRGLVFFGEAVAHSAFAGAGLALLLGLDPFIPVVIFGVSSAIGIQYINERKMMRDEIILGIFFTAMLALGLFFIGLINYYNTNVQAILFGDLLFITNENFLILIFTAIVVIMIILAFKKELHYITLDAEMAAISGIPVRTINYIFIILTAFVISVSLRAIGAILVFAMIITPAAAALQWTFKLNKLMIISAFFSVLSSFFGLMISFLFDFPSGASIVIIATIIFVISFGVSPKRRKSSEIPLECEYCKESFESEKTVCQECVGTIDTKHIHSDDRILLIDKNNAKHEHDHAKKNNAVQGHRSKDDPEGVT